MSEAEQLESYNPYSPHRDWMVYDEVEAKHAVQEALKLATREEIIKSLSYSFGITMEE